MFNKLKQFKDMRDQAKTLQDELAKETITVSSGGVEITMNGNLEVINVSISDDLMGSDKKSKLEKAFMDAHKDALKKMQRVMAMKMKDMGGMPNIPGMS